MKWQVTAGTGCLAHCLTDERWTVDLMIELLLNGPNCTIVCKLGKTRNTQQDPHHGTLVDWLTSVGDMSLGRNQGFNHKVTLSSIAVIQPLTLARRACDCLHQVGGGGRLSQDYGWLRVSTMVTSPGVQRDLAVFWKAVTSLWATIYTFNVEGDFPLSSSPCRKVRTRQCAGAR